MLSANEWQPLDLKLSVTMSTLGNMQGSMIDASESAVEVQSGNNDISYGWGVYRTANASSRLSFAFFLFIALITLCPPMVSAADKKSEHGTVICIGTSFFLFLFLSLLLFSNMVHF
jgi:hypothetical protein